MDRVKLSRIDEELGSSEVAALCFLCIDVVTRKRMEDIKDAKGLFQRLEEKGLMENDSFLFQLLHTIRREDLLNLLETDSRHLEEADANPLLSGYRVMLYQIYQNMSEQNFDKMKFLLDGQLDRRQIDTSKTALDLFAEMERSGFLSNRKLDVLHTTLLEFDQQLATTVQRYMEGLTQPAVPPHDSIDYQTARIPAQPTQPPPSIPETQPGYERETVLSDATPNPDSSSLPDTSDYYTLDHIPRGLCVVFNNEDFQGRLRRRAGTQEDEKVLNAVFTRLGFTVVVHNDLTADAMRREVNRLSTRNFTDDDALVLCVLSHGEKGCVYGSDAEEVLIQDLTFPFRSRQAPTLAKKPKLFFIQACQGSGYQSGAVACPPKPKQENLVKQSSLEEDAGRVQGERVPNDADFLLGMATVAEYKSFRNTLTGSIYIQELCRQLTRSAKSPEMDDILTVLTRVNREVSEEEFLTHKQMPEPKYTLTRKLVLKFV
uniref:caspase-8 n=1 Tax=Semicossyphus pulcher TaxID=241346 RepID=UPI0037E96D4B